MWQPTDSKAPRRAVTTATMLTVLVLLAGGVQSVGAGVNTIKKSPAVEKPATESAPAGDAPSPVTKPSSGLVTTPNPIRSTPTPLQAGDLGGVRTWKPIPAAGGGDGGESPAPPAPDAPVAQAASLEPGSGFGGATVEPQIVGDLAAPGATAKAIAHWDALPEELLSETRNLGVVAFHINGIDRVEFSLNGGPWLASRKMKLNKDTGVWEYGAPLDPRKLPDGPFEVRAIAYPTVGQPRLLESLTLVANTGGSVPQKALYVSLTGDDVGGDGSEAKPYQTIWKAASRIQSMHGAPWFASNGTVYLKAGDHRYAGKPQNQPRLKTGKGWLTIAAAPGLTRDQVRIVGNSAVYGGLYAGRVKFQNLSIVATSLKTDGTYSPAAWFDNCDLRGASPADPVRFANLSSWIGGVYYTDTHISNVVFGSIRAAMLRGCTLEDIGSDAFRDPRLVLNCKVNRIRKPAGTDFHPDLIQFWGNFDNVIVYGVEAHEVYAQGIFSEGKETVADRNIALVNIAIDQRSHLSQWSQAADHVLLWNITLLGKPFLIRNVDDGRPKNVLTNFSVRDSVFQEMRISPSIIPLTDQTIFRNNHFIEGLVMGRNATTGDPGLLVSGSNDEMFAPPTGSPLANRVLSPLVPVDASGERRPTPGAIGAIVAAN